MSESGIKGCHGAQLAVPPHADVRAAPRWALLHAEFLCQRGRLSVAFPGQFFVDHGGQSLSTAVFAPEDCSGSQPGHLRSEGSPGLRRSLVL